MELLSSLENIGINVISNVYGFRYIVVNKSRKEEVHDRYYHRAHRQKDVRFPFRGSSKTLWMVTNSDLSATKLHGEKRISEKDLARNIHDKPKINIKQPKNINNPGLSRK